MIDVSPPAQSGGTPFATGPWAKIAATAGGISVFLANITAILTHIDGIRNWLFKTFGLKFLEDAHAYALSLTIGAAVFGLTAIAYWLYQAAIFNKPDRIKLVFVLGSVFAVTSGAYAIGYVVPRPVVPRNVLQQQATSMTERIFTYQVDSGPKKGGLRWSTQGASNETQAWTTAQCLVAVLLSAHTASKYPIQIRAAFDFIERVKISKEDQGWGYMEGTQWGITEINAWITLAYLASLHPEVVNIIWRENEKIEIIKRVERNLSMLAASQYSNGAWGPTSRLDKQSHIRTYSSVMALWAFVEAKNVSVVAAAVQEKYDQAIRDGARWLIAKYSRNEVGAGSWWPDPATKSAGQNFFPGLSAQVLFVLERATEGFDFLSSSKELRNYKEEYFRTSIRGAGPISELAQRNVEDNETVLDSNRYLEDFPEVTAEASRFLWFPWSLMVSTEVSRHCNASPSCFGAPTLQSALLSRIDKLIRFAEADPCLFATGETLIAINFFLRTAAAAGSREQI